MPGHVKRIKRAKRGAAKGAAPPVASLFTSRDDTSTETDRTRG
jgi:hypothetical protein